MGMRVQTLYEVSFDELGLLVRGREVDFWCGNEDVDREELSKLVEPNKKYQLVETYEMG